MIRYDGKEVIAIRDDTIAQVEYAVAVLVRLLTATRPKNPRVAALDRSAYLILHEVLSHPEPLSVQDLATILKVDLSTMSRQIAVMESKGLLQRVLESDDSRTHQVRATPIGQTHFASMREARRGVYHQILQDWSADETKQLALALERLNESVRQYQVQGSNNENPPDTPS